MVEDMANAAILPIKREMPEERKKELDKYFHRAFLRLLLLLPKESLKKFFSPYLGGDFHRLLILLPKKFFSPYLGGDFHRLLILLLKKFFSPYRGGNTYPALFSRQREPCAFCGVAARRWGC